MSHTYLKCGASVMLSGEQCDHIIGYTNSPYDGGWLVKNEEDWYFDKPIDDGDDLVFTYCPLCGEKLKEE